MFTGLYHKGVIRLIFSTKYRRTPLTIYIYIYIFIILSLTVVEIKNRYNHCIYWLVAIFFVVMKLSNFLSSFTFFLNIFHLTFGYKLIVCSKITGIMKSICNFGSFIGWNKSLFLNFNEV